MENYSGKSRLSSFYALIVLFLLVLISPRAFAQSPVKGTVTSSRGERLAGVTVSVVGKTTAVMTDGTGHYAIPAAKGDRLQFTSIGFAAREVAVLGDENIDVVLDNELVAAMNEVVVIGYGTQKKATLTGSVSSVKGDELKKSPQPDVSNSFAGRVSGVIANNRSGEPGYDGSSILIRGLATTGNNDVLVVVDGVPGQIGGLSRLNPNDIEDISVLKDASAAVYGSRAANGVILVTTKKGKSGKPQISYNFNQAFTSPTRLPKLADAFTYATIQNEIAYYNSQDKGMNQIYSEEQLQKFKDGSDPLNYPNTNWPDLVLKKMALQSKHDISVSGGGENVKYFLSAGYLNQDGLYKNGVTRYKQYSFRSNVDANISKRLKVGLLLSGRQEDRMFPQSGAGDIFRFLYRAYPTVAAYYPNGLPTTGIENGNPAIMVTDIPGTNYNPTLVFNGVLKGAYEIPGVKGLALEGMFSVDKSSGFDKNFATPYNLYQYNAATGTYTPNVLGGIDKQATLYQSQTNQYQYVSNIRLNFDRRFDKHSINAFVGYEQSNYHSDNFSAYRKHFPTYTTPELSQGGTADADKSSDGGSYTYTRKSYLGRVAYNYSEKYMAEVQARVDGSSTFGPGHQYGFFPAVSAAWRISNEDWFHKGAVINDLKLRASYGILGNDNVGLFQYFNNYSLNSQYVINGVIVPGYDLTLLANPDITWEKAKKLDIGLNAVFLKHFNLEFIYFQQKRTDILAQRNASVPQLSGINSAIIPAENIGKVDNNGFEFTLGYNKRLDQDAGIYFSGNLTYAKSKIVDIDEAPGTPEWQKQTGRPLNTYLLYNSIGMMRTTDDFSTYPHPTTTPRQGDLVYQDYTKDGKIDANDMVRTKYGNIPQVTYGFTAGGDYKNIDLTILFAGQARVSQYVLPESGTIGNFYSSWADNRWSPSNPGGSYPRVDERASNSVNGGAYPSTFWLNDASFIRLKNVELGYTIVNPLLTRIKLSNVRVYASGFNLFTITKVKDYDPEGSSGSGQFYPQQRIINLGLNLRF
ncbi:SusC/RagA family TonB-linked outer membrane protein [Niabella drilacis]|uniref:TonB-linked outer membrane protein, SusC/RagA family n=1 Tax=Niabella drilacis (strain DSM 25811 / CCM 8410 / CCUG 62505 / LMG 26954 / E90) TaxID=1285928 RepID=A0A1G6ZMF9_NIADE|nr:TonB-dependent receptor [Niabella drilacis]SDE02726.1 TonB-linked outer membrane protein, SusC/RagA family [Niabella drilacis]